MGLLILAHVPMPDAMLNRSFARGQGAVCVTDGNEVPINVLDPARKARVPRFKRRKFT